MGEALKSVVVGDAVANSRQGRLERLINSYTVGAFAYSFPLAQDRRAPGIFCRNLIYSIAGYFLNTTVCVFEIQKATSLLATLLIAKDLSFPTTSCYIVASHV